MGSIASVLQWHCSECALINPTESTRCARCGITRLRSDEKANLRFNLSLEHKVPRQKEEGKQRNDEEGDSSSVSILPTSLPKLHLKKLPVDDTCPTAYEYIKTDLIHW